MGLLGTLIKGAGGAILAVAAAPVVVGGAVVSGVIASEAVDACEKVDNKTREEMKNIPKKND